MSNGMGNNSSSTFTAASFGRLKKIIKGNKPAPLDSTTLEINLVDGNNLNVDVAGLWENIDHGGELLVKDVIKDICRIKGIYPKSVGFFGLKCENSSTNKSKWVVQTQTADKIKPDKKHKYHFRLQLKVLSGTDLRKRDSKAYDYYLKQCRYDFKNGAFAKQLEGKENEKILLRTVILEMMMVSMEQSIPLKEVLKSKKKFNIEELLRKYYDREGPRDVSKCKQKVEKSLNCFAKVQEPDKDFITEIELLSNYRDEIFYLQKYERGGGNANQFELWITPMEVHKKVLSSNVRSTLWHSPYSIFHRFKVCEKEEGKGTKVMILRGDEPPELIYCSTDEICESVCSFLDAYFRLHVNQYNSILHDSAEYLQSSPYHGPIDREVAIKILRKKGRQPGNYLIREHTLYYNWFVLSLISDDADHAFKHLEVKRTEVNNKIMYAIDPKRQFETIQQLQEFYMDETNGKDINGQLRNNISPKIAGEVPLYTNPANFRPNFPDSMIHDLAPASVLGPSLLDLREMVSESFLKNGTFGEVIRYRTKDKQEIIVKRFKLLQMEMLSDVSRTLQLLQSHANIVKFIGLSLCSDKSLAFEYMPLGPLDTYLQTHRDEITYGSMIKYLYQLTDALTFIHSKELVHSDLRLSNVYVYDLNIIKLGNACITWKLAGFKMLDEKIFRKRFTHLAPEIFLRENAEFTQKTDVWSFGLTVWQLFTLEKPFRNCTTPQLMPFFKLRLESQHLEQPALINLNMYILRYCNELLYNLLNGCLHMVAERRLTMKEVFEKVSEFQEKAPSRDKQKLYFVFDWESRKQEEESQKNMYASGDSSYFSGGSNLSNSTHSLNGIIGNIKNGCDMDEGIKIKEEAIKCREEQVKRKEPVESCENQNHVEMLDKSVSNVVSRAGQADENMQVDSVGHKLSYSVPSSPTRPKMFRSNSADDRGKRGEEELETASILMGLSQTNGPEPEGRTAVPLLPQTKASSIFYPGYPSVGTRFVQPCKKVELFDASGKPVRFMTQVPSQEYLKNVFQHQWHTTAHPIHNKPAYAPKLENLANVVKSATAKNTPPPSPPPPPPDSPEASRREFASEQPKRDTPRDDKTRRFLQERINKERERFHGKRSLSFTEEFDEYKNNTKRQAKRALMGPNPFNIGVPLPDDFLLRSDKRIFQAVPALPRDVTRFFKQDTDLSKEHYSNYQNGKGSSSALDPYKTMRDLQNFRESTLKSSENKSSAFDPYKSPAEIQSVMKGIQDMQAHSPNHLPFDEMRAFSVGYCKSNQINSVSSTINVFSNNPGISSIRMPLQVMRFPYAHPATGATGHTVRLSCSIPPESILVSSSGKKPGRKPKDNKYVLPQPSGTTAFSTVNRPPQLHMPAELPAGHQAIGVPLLTINNPSVQIPPHFIPRVVAVNTSHGPPPLHRAGTPRVIPSSTIFLPHTIHPGTTVFQQQRTLVPNRFQIPASMSLVPVSLSEVAENSNKKQMVTIKSEPIDEPVAVKSEPTEHLSSVEDPYKKDTFTRTSSVVQTVPGIFHEVDKSGNKDSSGGVFRYIKSKDLRTDKLLGKGQFGDVFRGTWLFTDKNQIKHEVPVAVKRLRTEQVTPTAKEEFRNEAEAMANLNKDPADEAKYIIKLYGVCTDGKDNEFSIITELLELGPLDLYISSKKNELNVGNILFYCRQIADGMEYLHNKKMLHRDLACRNILVHNKEQVKICDFGLSRWFEDQGYYRSKATDQKWPLQWLALESIEKKIFSKETDYWSFGVTIWEMFTLFDPEVKEPRAVPYHDIANQDLPGHLQAGNRLTQPPLCSDELWELVKKSWSAKKSERPTFYMFSTKLRTLLGEVEFVM